ncbi:MAG: nitroreductase family protein [Planctomycetia bacterium]|nr:nitroreductase family protein [Planctomycetia bacterium]
MDFLELAKSRYSVRQFSDKPVAEAMVDKILEAARVAPTACNLQPAHLVVVRTEEGMKKLRECTPFSWMDVPLAIIVYGDASRAWVRAYDGDNAAVVDASIIGTHILMEIAELGLGTTWIGCFDPAKVKQFFPMDATLQPIAIFPIGWPADDARPNPMHFQRKEREQFVTYC